MGDPFYASFEKCFRGPRALIKQRLQVYLPSLHPLIDHYKQFTAVDLGCGRGEWLELLSESGLSVRGVDIDDGMLLACRQLGFKVETNDALSCLKQLRDESESVISAFHLIEHIRFDDLRALIAQSHRVLSPGGMLILETPNPENLRVSTETFYTDPTHIRPLPPPLIEFLVKYTGFARVNVLRLQSQLNPSNLSKVNLHDVLTHVSPDYAVVALKNGPSELLDAIQQELDKVEGVTLEMLANSFDAEKTNELSILRDQTSIQASILGDKIDSMYHDLERIEPQLAELKAFNNQNLIALRHNKHKVTQLNDQAAHLHDEVAHLHDEVAQLRKQLTQSQERMANTINELKAVYSSTSWSVTHPIRWLGDQVKYPRVRSSISRFKQKTSKVLRWTLSEYRQSSTLPSSRNLHRLYDPLDSLMQDSTFQFKTDEQVKPSQTDTILQRILSENESA